MGWLPRRTSGVGEKPPFPRVASPPDRDYGRELYAPTAGGQTRQNAASPGSPRYFTVDWKRAGSELFAVPQRLLSKAQMFGQYQQVPVNQSIAVGWNARHSPQEFCLQAKLLNTDHGLNVSLRECYGLGWSARRVEANPHVTV